MVLCMGREQGILRDVCAYTEWRCPKSEKLRRYEEDIQMAFHTFEQWYDSGTKHKAYNQN